MTDAQKKYIIDMRAEGQGVTMIAQTLDLSVNTIKSYLRRYDLAKSKASEEQRSKAVKASYVQCKQCGSYVPQKDGVKSRLFCDATCRNRWWNQRRSIPGRKSYQEYTCSCCHKPFTSNRAKRKYCSQPCYFTGRYGKEVHHVTGTV